MLEKKTKVILVGDAEQKRNFINGLRKSKLPPYGFVTESFEFGQVVIWHLVSNQYFKNVHQLHSDAQAIIYFNPSKLLESRFEHHRDPAVTLAFDYGQIKLSPRDLMRKIIFLIKPGEMAKEKKQHYDKDMQKNMLLFRAKASPESVLYTAPKEVVGLIANQYLQLNAVTRCSFFAYPCYPVEQKKEEVDSQRLYRFSLLPI